MIKNHKGSKLLNQLRISVNLRIPMTSNAIAIQILKLLRGEEDAKELVHVDVKGSGNQEDDESYDFGGKPRLDFSILDIDFDAHLVVV